MPPTFARRREVAPQRHTPTTLPSEETAPPLQPRRSNTPPRSITYSARSASLHALRPKVPGEPRRKSAIASIPAWPSTLRHPLLLPLLSPSQQEGAKRFTAAEPAPEGPVTKPQRARQIDARDFAPSRAARRAAAPKGPVGRPAAAKRRLGSQQPWVRRPPSLLPLGSAAEGSTSSLHLPLPTPPAQPCPSRSQPPPVISTLNGGSSFATPPPVTPPAPSASLPSHRAPKKLPTPLPLPPQPQPRPGASSRQPLAKTATPTGSHTPGPLVPPPRTAARLARTRSSHAQPRSNPPTLLP